MISLSRTIAVVLVAGSAIVARADSQAVRLRNPVPVATRGVLSAPSNVAVTGDEQRATVTWAPGFGAVAVEVFRSQLAQSVGCPIAQLGSGAATYTDATAATGQTYYYSVASVGADGRRLPSQIVTWTPPYTKLRKPVPGRGVAPPPPPVILGISPCAPSPGQLVTLSGSSLTGATAITVSGVMQVGTAIAPASVASVSYPSPTELRFQMPLHSSWTHGQSVTIVVATAAGASSAFLATVDRIATITGVSSPLVRAGGQRAIALQGRNLDRVVAGYIGATAVNTASNPRLAASPGWLGLEAQIYAPPGCSREGILLVEESSNGTVSAGGPFLVSNPSVRGGCGITPEATAVTPAVAPPGATVRVSGKGFTWLTGVQAGSGSLTWTPISDTEFSLQLPSMAGAYGAVAMSPLLLNQIPDATVPGTFRSPVVVAYPPLAENLTATWAECCEPVTIRGRGLADPALPATVTVGASTVVLTSATATSITFTMPNPAANDMGGPVPVTVRHAGGTSTVPAQLIVVTQPSVITSISPAQIPANVATVVTVRGTNLARARGICLPGASPTGPIVTRTDPVTGNDELKVTVSSTPVSGPVSVAVPPNVTQRQYTICQANPQPVTITQQ